MLRKVVCALKQKPVDAIRSKALRLNTYDVRQHKQAIESPPAMTVLKNKFAKGVFVPVAIDPASNLIVQSSQAVIAQAIITFFDLWRGIQC